MFHVLTDIYRKFANIFCCSAWFLPDFLHGQSMLEDVDFVQKQLPEPQLEQKQIETTIEPKKDNILSDPVPELDQIEQKRARNRIYKQRYAEKKRREKEQAAAREIILHFNNKREHSTPAELEGFIIAIGQQAADILHELLGDDEFQEFVASHSGETKLNLICAMIAALEQILSNYSQ